MNVAYTNARTWVSGALTVEGSVAAGTRGTGFGYSTFTIAQTTATISNYRIISMLIDEADRMQQGYWGSPAIAAHQGRKLDEYLEAQMLAQHTSWVDFGQGDLDNTAADSAVLIGLTASNIARLIRAINRKLRTNNGSDVMREFGVFIIHRPEDLELLEEYAMATGFNTADEAIRSGLPSGGFNYMGVTHLLSTQHTANHLFAGVKKIGKDLGILRGTFGRVKFKEDPADGDGDISGLGIRSRVDYGWAFPSDATPATQRQQEMCIDVNVT